MPIRPSSNSLSMSWRGIFACSSISRTWGRISRSANSYTLSRNSASSSCKVVRLRGVSEGGTGPLRAREMQTANLRAVDFQVVLSRKRRSTTGMSRTPIAVFLTVALAMIQAGTRRPQAAPQSSAPQGSGAQQTGGAPQPEQGAAPQPEQGAAPQQPTFRADVNFVRVDVIVHDGKGQPV